jgi:carbon monoxide dehydrogenase subunit G
MRFGDAIVINRSVADVWAFLQQPNSEAAWHPGVIEERMTSAGGLGVGATGIEVRKVFGRHMEFPWEITGFEPGRRVITTSMGGGPVAWEATYLLEPVENGTRFTLDYRQEATGLWRLLLLGAPIVMRRLAKSDLVRPKRAVEALRPLDD